MDKKEIKARADHMLEAGRSRSEVFGLLAGRGLKDRALAYHVAAWPAPARVAAQRGKVRVLIGVMALQALLAFVLGFDMGTTMSAGARWTMALLIAAIPLLFAWGFHRNRVGAYNGYILLSVIQLPRQFDGFSDSPVASSLAVAVSLAILGFAAVLRYRLFPDFMWMSPRKVRGEYVFAG